MVRFCLGAAALLTLAFTALPAAADDTQAARTDAEIQALVRAYLLENPEVIEDALIALGEKRERARFEDNKDALLNDPRDFSTGPDDAPLTIVEFFDYNCGFCKRSTEWIRAVMDTHGDDVRVVFKEAPVFGGRIESSALAAKTALAAIDQDKYLDIHFALMQAEGNLDPDDVDAIAKAHGLKMRWLLNARDDEAHDLHLAENLLLGEAVGMRGTPFFFVNGVAVEGANFERLDALVAEALGPAEG